MESDGDTDKCIYTAEVKTSLYILDKKVKRLVHIDEGTEKGSLKAIK